ncbi:MAG: hypothetical protein JW751_30845 [Polyangiaceae bacterium]|nr:hypothetical protein [Polyangiaceae bacterium]
MTQCNPSTLLVALLLAGGLATGGCGDPSPTDTSTAGGIAGTGGADAAGGTAVGGSMTNAGGAGGTGDPLTGGIASGGVPTGGSNAGGSATGGAAMGGVAAAGTATGGDGTGGMATGGGSTGGAATGGVGTGGDSVGGDGAGGDGAGGGGTGGMVTGGDGPGGIGTGGDTTGGVPSTDVTVDLAQPRQTMDGFGINITWGTSLTPDRAEQLFNPDTGLGLNIVRIGMGDNGDQLSNNIWGDMQMAQEHGAEVFIGTLWSPPARMKTNNSVNDGGHLRPEYYEEWAETIAAFPARVKQNTGIDLYGMSPQNETDFASCGMSEPCNGSYPTTLYTGAEYAAFIKVVGPKLRALNPPVKVISPEASEWLHVWSNESACCSEPGGQPSSDPLDCGFPATNCTGFDGYDYGHALYADPEAWAAFDILGTHQYDTQVAEPWPEDVPDRKPVWQTEMSGVKWWPEQGPSSHIENGVAIARWVHNALTVGEANAWLWWWEQAGSTNEGLILNGATTKRFWTFCNFTRFIRPGYTRVHVTGEIPQDVLLAAFTGDGKLVIVAINEGAASVDFSIAIAGGTAPGSLTPWVTSASDDLAAQAAVTVSDGVFTASLAGTTVTTFVGQ